MTLGYKLEHFLINEGFIDYEKTNKKIDEDKINALKTNEIVIYLYKENDKWHTEYYIK